MPVLERSRDVTAQRDLVWAVIAAPAPAEAIAPGAERIDSVEGSAADTVRRVTGEAGAAWQEKCVAWQPGQYVTFEVDPAHFPLAVKSLRYTCALEDRDAGVRLRLYFDYQPAFGPLGTLVDRLGVQRQLVRWADAALDQWVRRIHVREWAYRVTVSTLLDEKGRHVHSVSPDSTIAATAARLRAERIGSVLVTRADGSIAGVVSERDIVRGLAERGPALLEEQVESIMTRDVIVARPGDNMMFVMSCMSENRIRHLPVVDNDRVIGLISIGDVVKARISELEGQSETLRDYIAARRWNELYREIGPAAYDQATGALNQQPQGAKP